MEDQANAVIRSDIRTVGTENRAGLQETHQKIERNFMVILTVMPEKILYEPERTKDRNLSAKLLYHLTFESLLR